MDEASEAIFKRSTRAPWLHGLRMMAQAGKRWPLASVDSVNVARNYKDREEMPSFMAERLDRQNNTTIVAMNGMSAAPKSREFENVAA